MGSSYARSFVSLHLPRHPAAITTPHRLYVADPAVITSSVAPHSVVVLGLLLLTELAAAQRAPKTPAVVRQRQEQAALPLSCQRHRAQLADPPAQVVGSSYGRASDVPTAMAGSGSA
jgi:hypothetical protein